MRRISPAGLLALALIVSWIERASGGSVHLTKAEVRAARISLYEHEMALYNRDPVRFEEHHPVLGRILASEEGYDAFLANHTFPKLLCVHTPFLWRVIAGDTLYHKIHPWGAPPTIPDVDPPPPGGTGPDYNPPGGGGPDGGGPTIHPAAVPEPSSCVVLATGVGFLAVVAARRRIYARWRTRRRAH